MKSSITKSRALRWTAVASLLIPLAVFSTSSAQAASGPYLIDGDIPDDAGFANLPDLYGAVKELGPLNSNTTKIGVIHSDAVPTLGETNPNAQVDLRQAWIDTQRTTGTDPKDWLYFAWERDKSTGSGFIAYEFMKSEEPAACDYTDSTADLIATCNPWANRQAGDFMILWDQQGGSTDLFLRTWSGTAPNLTLSAPIAIPTQLGEAQYSDDGFFGEAAINLTDTIGGGQLKCLSFANTIPSTVTGNSDTADYKDTILAESEPITNCASTTETTPKDAAGADIPVGGLSIGTGYVGVRDSAVVDITGATTKPTPAGSVQFHLCKVNSPGLCTTGGTQIGSPVTLVGKPSYPATVQSPVAYVTSAGRYCWRAEYTGDSANGITGSDDSRANECFTVNPVTPGLTTQAGAGGTLGSSVTDSATLSGTANQPTANIIETTLAAAQGGAPAGGTITFKLYGPRPAAGGCGPLVYTSPTGVPVSGNDTYASGSFTPTAAGAYDWVATYSGNSPNTNTVTHNAACTDGNERVTITTVAASMTTAQTWVPRDSATISASAGGALAGTVSFTLYPTSNCSGTAIDSATASVAGASPQTVGSGAFPAQAASGSFSWSVSYDSTNPAQRDIPASCHETSALTVTNGGTISSP